MHTVQLTFFSLYKWHWRLRVLSLCHGQRPAGLTKENRTTFSDPTRPTEKSGHYYFYHFPQFPTWVKSKENEGTFAPSFRLDEIYCKKHKIMFKPVCQNGAALRSERSNNQIGPLPEVVPNFAVSPNRNGLFHMTFYQKHRNFWHNGKHRWFFNRTRLTPFIVFVFFFFVWWEKVGHESAPAQHLIRFLFICGNMFTHSDSKKVI